MEAAAALDTMQVVQLIGESRYARGVELLQAIVAMLSATFTSKVALMFTFTSKSTSRPTVAERHWR